MRPYGRANAYSARRGSGRRPGAPYPRDRNINLPRLKPDHLLLHDGTQRSRTIEKAKDEARVAKEWIEHFNKAFDNKEIELRRPTNSHLVPNSESLQRKLDEINAETLGRWKETINLHLQETVTSAEERAANPPNSEQELLIATVATTVEATIKQILDKMNVQKK